MAALVKVPNDTLYSQQWALNNNAGVDINAPEAWYINTGSRDIVVAVMDDGTSYNHPDLQQNLWNRDRAIAKVPTASQTAFKAEYGTFGWDSYDKGPDVAPTTGTGDGHGTAVAGVIGAIGNNYTANNRDLGSVAGINWNASIYSAKVTSDQSTPPSITAFHDAVTRIIDLRRKYNQNVVAVVGSFAGWANTDPGFGTDIDALNNAGILFVSPAGDALGAGINSSGVSIDPPNPGYFPASTQQTVQINGNLAVAASTSSDALATWSDYGPTTVQIAAPGANVLSLDINNKVNPWNGTSLAAGYVGGVAGLVAAEYSRWTRSLPSVRFMQQAILDGAKQIAGLTASVQNGRRLDAFGSLQWVDTHLPPAISVNSVAKPEADTGLTPFTFTATLVQFDVATQRKLPATAATAITVTYSTADITAKADVDYQPVVGGTFTIAAGSSTGTFTINVIGNTKAEPTKKFQVNFTGVTGGDAWLSGTSTIGSILNDDPTPLQPAVTFSGNYGTPGNYATTMAAGEPSLAPYFTKSLSVTLDGGGGASAQRPTVVSYRVIPGGPNPAQPQVDFIPQTGTTTIPAGQKVGSIPVRIVNRASQQTTGTFLVEITALTPGMMKPGQSCIVTLTNAYAIPSVTLSYPVDAQGNPLSQLPEGIGIANFIVSLSNPAAIPVRVVYELVNGTAVSGSDFLGTLGQVTIPAGQISANIPVQIVDDRRVESTESFTMRINSVYGATINPPLSQSLQVDILDNDTPAAANASLAAAFAAYGASNSQSTSTTTTKKSAAAA